MTSSSCCPRDGTPLATGAGALAEAVCVRCQGRLLDADATTRLFCELLGIREEVLRELARDGARRIACPACRSTMTTTIARSVQVDLCPGCGGCWLDAGELQRLGGNVVDEVVVRQHPEAADGLSSASSGSSAAATSSGLELDRSRSRPAAPALRMEVRCTNCDECLDLRRTNWLVNTRPWCPSCAAPHVSLFAGVMSSIGQLFRAMWTMSALHRVLSGPMSLHDAAWEKSPDVLRVEPHDVDRFFGSFFTRAR